MSDLEATYSVEDNKLRLYASSRLDKELYLRVKDAGFKWAPKQELFVAPMWTPAREDFCIELAGEITAEQTTMVERAEAKMDRLEGIAENRATQADAFANAARDISSNIPFGQPILIGHHSEKRARKDQERISSNIEKSVKASEAVKYWNWKIIGVQAHANHKNDPRVRTRRIETLLKSLRDHQRVKNDAENYLGIWIRDLSDDQIETLSGSYSGASTHLYHQLKKGDITHAECKAKNIERLENTISSTFRQRWLTHYLNRLSYERQMLGPVEVYTKDLTPVILQTFARKMGAEKPKATLSDYGYILESPVTLPLHIAPTRSVELTNTEWRELMQASGYEVPTPVERRQSTSTKTKSPIINPTDEDLIRLQALWNIQIAESHKRAKSYGDPKIANVTLVPQSLYSAHSKGSYAHFKTVGITSDGVRVQSGWKDGVYQLIGVPVFRLRVSTRSYDLYQAYSAIQIIDKPKKSLPLDWEKLAIREKVEELS